jgi:hypothetical protein
VTLRLDLKRWPHEIFGKQEGGRGNKKKIKLKTQKNLTWSIIYRSVSTALSLLSLAHMYMVPDLVSPVLQYLIHNTSEDSVLLVLQDVLLYHRYIKQYCT